MGEGFDASDDEGMYPCAWHNTLGTTSSLARHGPDFLARTSSYIQWNFPVPPRLVEREPCAGMSGGRHALPDPCAACSSRMNRMHALPDPCGDMWGGRLAPRDIKS